MKIRKGLFVLVLMFISATLFAFSPKTESFVIRNYSSKNVVINREFWSESNDESASYHEQKIDNVKLEITDMMVHDRLPYVLRPNRSLELIRYFPAYLEYEKMEAIPFMYKMKSIFKKLEIICDDGKTVITLENLDERIIKKSEGLTEYILEIFDYDLVGKPAKEW